MAIALEQAPALLFFNIAFLRIFFCLFILLSCPVCKDRMTVDKITPARFIRNLVDKMKVGFGFIWGNLAPFMSFNIISPWYHRSSAKTMIWAAMLS